MRDYAKPYGTFMKRLMIFVVLLNFACDDSEHYYPQTFYLTINGSIVTYDQTGVLDSVLFTDKHAIDSMMSWLYDREFIYPDTFFTTDKRTIYAKYSALSPNPERSNTNSRPLTIVHQDSSLLFYDKNDKKRLLFSFKSDPPRFFGDGWFHLVTLHDPSGYIVGQATSDVPRDYPPSWTYVTKVTLWRFNVVYEPLE